jgi:hypothetical protein
MRSSPLKILRRMHAYADSSRRALDKFTNRAPERAFEEILASLDNGIWEDFRQVNGFIQIAWGF